MKTQKRRCKCLHCNELFLPDHRHQTRQRFCSQAPCQKARKQANQKAWLAKPENENYFQGDENEGGTKSGVAMVDASSLNQLENAKTAHASTGELSEGPRVGPPTNCEVAKTFKIDPLISNRLQMALSRISEASLPSTPDFVPLS